MLKHLVLAGFSCVAAVSLSACATPISDHKQAGYEDLNVVRPSASAENSVQGAGHAEDRVKALPPKSLREMPNFKGHELEEVVEEITEHFSKISFAVASLSQNDGECGDGQKLLVSSQIPSAGTMVRNGPESHVKLTVKCDIPVDEDDDDDDDD